MRILIQFRCLTTKYVLKCPVTSKKHFKCDKRLGEKSIFSLVNTSVENALI